MQEPSGVESENKQAPLELFEIRTETIDENETKRFTPGQFEDSSGAWVYKLAGNNGFVRFLPDDFKGLRYSQMEKLEGGKSVGGYGGVFKMLDNKTGRIVVAKEVVGEGAPTVLEARKHSKFIHPNISVVHDLAVSQKPGRFGQRVYLITEWLEGQSLFDWMKEKHSIKEVANIFKQVADGISYMNEQNWAYGDLKPENSMFDHLGTLKILDLGTATRLNKENKARGTPIGTPPCVAPEQVFGKFSLKNDVYSFGILVWEMLAKPESLFGASAHFFMEKESDLLDLKPEFKLVFDQDPEALLRISQMIRKCINHNPDLRFESVGVANREIQKLLIEIDKS